MSLLAFVNCIGLAFVSFVKYRKQQAGERAPLFRLNGISCSQKGAPGLVFLHCCKRQLKEIILYDKIIAIIDYLGFSNILGKIPSSMENGALN